MICNFCRNEIDDASTVCPYCGQPITPVQPQTQDYDNSFTQPEQEPAPQDTAYYHLPEQQEFNKQGEYTAPNQPQQNTDRGYYQPQYYQQQQYQYQQQQYQQPNNGYYYQGTDIRKEIENSKILGIVSILVGVFISGIAGIICGAIGLSKVNPFYHSYPMDPEIKSARSLNKWGIGLSAGLRIGCFIIIMIVSVIFAFTGYSNDFGMLY